MEGRPSEVSGEVIPEAQRSGSTLSQAAKVKGQKQEQAWEVGRIGSGLKTGRIWENFPREWADLHLG